MGEFPDVFRRTAQRGIESGVGVKRLSCLGYGGELRQRVGDAALLSGLVHDLVPRV